MYFAILLMNCYLFDLTKGEKYSYLMCLCNFKYFQMCLYLMFDSVNCHFIPMHTLRGSFFEPHYFQLVSNSLPYCTHIKLIVKVKKGEIVSLEEVYTILKF